MNLWFRQFANCPCSKSEFDCFRSDCPPVPQKCKPPSLNKHPGNHGEFPMRRPLIVVHLNLRHAVVNPLTLQPLAPTIFERRPHYLGKLLRPFDHPKSYPTCRRKRWQCCSIHSFFTDYGVWVATPSCPCSEWEFDHQLDRLIHHLYRN